VVHLQKETCNLRHPMHLCHHVHTTSSRHLLNSHTHKTHTFCYTTRPWSVPSMNESCHTYESVLSHTWTSQIIHISESWPKWLTTNDSHMIITLWHPTSHPPQPRVHLHVLKNGIWILTHHTTSPLCIFAVVNTRDFWFEDGPQMGAVKSTPATDIFWVGPTRCYHTSKDDLQTNE